MGVLNSDFSLNILDTLFKKSKRIFFIGIGGISMSALAKFCLSENKTVFGCDNKITDMTTQLEKDCHIKYYSSTDNVYGMDMVIYTTAIDENNFEYAYAKKLNIPLVSRANFLGYVMSKYKRRIGICGMHGKSTVTCMLHHIFSFANKKPTTFCGGDMIEYGNCVLGNEDYFIFESCEYGDSFLRFCPDESIITNIDFDHPDYFKDTEQIVKSFQKYADLNGRVYINNDDELSKKIKHSEIITYGIHNSADYIAKTVHSPHKNEFLVLKSGKEIARCKLNFYGEHYVYDALCAFCVAYENGIDVGTIENALSTFKGTKRRMEFVKKSDTGVDIYCDYAHHPTEIKSTVNGLKFMGYKRIVCIFQPHTFSRTYYLYDEFKNAFEGVDNLIFAPTFSAREENVYGFTDNDFALHCGGILINEYEKIVDCVSKIPTDVIIIMGAGNINELKKFF
ncbi:MAG: UDP-N-acetylmuramate--L-alanine ligase [Clostridia bacterium]|nr:UDP-N-acetylmuramate--L-alanine ligase [Clostridia bacterium]